MKLEETAIQGVWRITAEPRQDPRGFFARTYCHETFRLHGLPFGAVRQTSVSHNSVRGTLRGLHWQETTAPEAKIVRVLKGRIFDVALDLRYGSPTYLKWYGTELSGEYQDALLLPAGCAHGFLTLEDSSAVEYLMDADYVPELARGARWNDRAFNISWPLPPAMMSEQDKTWPDFKP